MPPPPAETRLMPTMPLSSVRRPLRATTTALVTLLCLAAALAVPAAARAAVVALPSVSRLVDVTPSSFTVAVHRTAGAKQYRLFASTRKSDLYYADLVSGHDTAH